MLSAESFCSLNLGKNISYTPDGNYIPNEDFSTAVIDIRLELER